MGETSVSPILLISNGKLKTVAIVTQPAFYNSVRLLSSIFNLMYWRFN